MKKILIILFCLLSISFTVFSQPNFNNLQRQNPSLEFVWAKQIFGVTGDMDEFNSCYDKYGNIYICGIFKGKCTIGNVDMYCSRTNTNGFYAKFDKNGNLKWMKNIGGWTQDDYVISIALDDSFVYAVCEILDSFKIDLVYQNVRSDGSYDTFIAKSDINTGEVVSYVRAFYSTTSSNQRATDIIVDNEGNLVLTLITSTNSVIFIDTTINCIVPTKIFLLKLNSLLSRISGWPKLTSSTGTTTTSRFFSISYDDYNNYYMSGCFKGTTYFDIDTIIPVKDNSHGFLYKTNSNGAGQWLRKIQGEGLEQLTKVKFKNGRIITLGTTYSTSWLRVDSTISDTSKIPFVSKGLADGLYLCYNDDGTLQYWSNLGSTGNDLLYYNSSSSLNSFFTGRFSATFTFQGKTFTYSGGTGYDAMGLFLDNNGVLKQAITGTGLLEDVGKTNSIDNDNNFYMVGTFKSNPFTIGTQTFTNTDGFRDLFIAKYRMKY